MQLPASSVKNNPGWQPLGIHAHVDARQLAAIRDRAERLTLNTVPHSSRPPTRAPRVPALPCVAVIE